MINRMMIIIISRMMIVVLIRIIRIVTRTMIITGLIIRIRI